MKMAVGHSTDDRKPERGHSNLVRLYKPVLARVSVQVGTWVRSSHLACESSSVMMILASNSYSLVYIGLLRLNSAYGGRSVSPP